MLTRVRCVPGRCRHHRHMFCLSCHGPDGHDTSRRLVKRAILASSARVILAATSDKLSRTSSFRFGGIEDIDDLVTMQDAPQATLDAFRAAGSKVHVTD